MVEEKSVLEPIFETFGGLPSSPGMQIQFGPPPPKTRLWFLSSDGDHLIQFQEDRLLLNWRKMSNGGVYPRYENISKRFGKYLRDTQAVFDRLFNAPLDITQAEISYINIIPLEGDSQVGDWLDFGFVGTLNHEAFSFQFGEVISAKDGRPYGRLIAEIKSAVTVNGEGKALQFTLTFRGKPFAKDIPSAMDFLRAGREKIVIRFDDLTTEKAHFHWGKRA